MPLLSFMVPVYNRARVVGRCLDSVLRQDHADYEIVAVDDGSSDGSLDILHRYESERVRVFRHERNQGVGPACNTAIQHARGDWIARLDSDDELVDGSLARICGYLAALPDDVDSALFSVKLDDGTVSPDPPPGTEIIDYVGWIRFLERHIDKPHQFASCTRARTFGTVRMPETSGLEELYHFDFYKNFRSRVFPEVVHLYHQDAVNQLTRRVSAFDPARDATFVRDRADILERVIAQHGEALRRHGPGLYRQYASRLAVLEFLLGRRGRGLRLSVEAFRMQPLSLRDWIIPLLGLWGPRPLLWARSVRNRHARGLPEAPAR